MRQIENAIHSYHKWLFHGQNDRAESFILLCVAAGLALFFFGPIGLQPLALLLVGAAAVPIIDRRIRRHPGENFLRVVDEEYLGAYSNFFAGEMRRRGAPEGMINMDVGLIWIYRQMEDHQALFLHLTNLQTKLENIDDVSVVHETELPSVPTGESPAETS